MFKDLIANLSDFLTYFVPGYLSIIIFNYFSSKDLEKSIEYLLIKCIIFSYTSIIIADLFVCKEDPYYFITIIFVAVMLGVAISILFRISKFFTNSKLYNHVFPFPQRTGKLTIWQDIIDSVEQDKKQSGKKRYDLKAIVFPKNGDKIYVGKINFIEEKTDNPFIILKYFKVYNGTNLGDVTLNEDYIETIEEENEKILVLNFSNISEMQIESIFYD